MSFRMDWTDDSPTLFPLKVTLLILDPLHLHVHIRMSLSISTKSKAFWNFHWGFIKSLDSFRENCHLNNVNSSKPLDVSMFPFI